MTRHTVLAKTFQIPLMVFGGIVLYILLHYFSLTLLSMVVIIATIILGSYQLFIETYNDIRKGNFALDYLAILAILVSLITNEYLVASIIALMITSGRTLEQYGVSKAKASLTSLIDRIPDEVTLFTQNKADKKVKIEKITIGQEIFIRSGEVISLDGTLQSKSAVIDESSLTGEPLPVEKTKGDMIKSGTVNTGNPLIIKVVHKEADSTYYKIIAMVQDAQNEKAPLVRIADRYSTYFTLISLIIAGFGFYLSHDLHRVLSVLVIATPCPLILATPIALLGGMNAAAKKRIIVKRLAALEALSRVNAIIFDKTGTITLGKPVVTAFTVQTTLYKKEALLAIAQSIERNSLHPLAKAIVRFAENHHIPPLPVADVEETIGIGISGTIENKTYTLSKIPDQNGMTIGIFRNKKILGTFFFVDEIKQDAKYIMKQFNQLGLTLYIFTGDKKEAAEKVAAELGEGVILKAECSPEDKKTEIEVLKKQGKIVAMVGDGINDAPALARADVGMVFSNEEQTASSETADIVFLGGDFSQAYTSLRIAKQTIRIALTSIYLGIGLAIFGMGFASIGYIPPLVGAIMQEIIDVVSIVNALRASKAS